MARVLLGVSFVLKHRFGVDNKAANTLGKKIATSQSMSAKVVGFERLIHEYLTCRDFDEIYLSLTQDPPVFC